MPKTLGCKYGLENQFVTNAQFLYRQDVSELFCKNPGFMI